MIGDVKKLGKLKYKIARLCGRCKLFYYKIYRSVDIPNKSRAIVYKNGLEQIGSCFGKLFINWTDDCLRKETPSQVTIETRFSKGCAHIKKAYEEKNKIYVKSAKERFQFVVDNADKAKVNIKTRKLRTDNKDIPFYCPAELKLMDMYKKSAEKALEYIKDWEESQ